MSIYAHENRISFHKCPKIERFVMWGDMFKSCHSDF